MGRIYNFSAGPATLPEAVLKEAAEEMLDYLEDCHNNRQSCHHIDGKASGQSYKSVE